MRGAITAALLVLPGVLAGCLTEPDLSTGDPLGTLLPAELFCDASAPPKCNFEATLTPETRQANELSIAVNPTDPLNMIATGKDYTPEEAGDCVWAGIYTTFDGGKTWKNQNVPGSPWKKLLDPSAPVTEFSQFWCVTDPVVAFGPDGTAYWTVMPYQCDRISGSKTGRGVHPNGGFNDWFWTCSSMYVLVSEDGGATWPRWQQVAFGPRLEHDKQWIATAPNGNVLLCWDRGNPYDVNQLANPVAEQLAGNSVVLCSVSEDKGLSWSENKEMNPDWGGAYPAVEYDANNTAYAALGAGDEIVVSSSRDGLAWSAPVAVGKVELPPAGGEYGWPVLRGSDFRALSIPLIAVDRSEGPYSGSVYVTWFDHSQGEGDVLVSYSRDGGATWSNATKVHDDDPALKADQFYPAISVGPDGTVDVSWWDRRLDPENHLFDVFYTYSKDGGQSWAANLRATEVSSDEQYSRHQNGMVFLGDYRDQDSSALGAHLVWVDTRNQKADVFTATVRR